MSRRRGRFTENQETMLFLQSICANDLTPGERRTLASLVARGLVEWVAPGRYAPSREGRAALNRALGAISS